VIPALIVLAYLGVVVYIGVFAFRRAHGRKEVEDYFLANRSLGPFVFLMSLFGTNMTAFSILGSSGHAFANGIVRIENGIAQQALIIGPAVKRGEGGMDGDEAAAALHVMTQGIP